MQIPVTDTYQGRSSLLSGLPKVSINRSQENPQLDLNTIVNQFIDLGRDKKSGVRPLIVIVDNALDYVGDWQNDLTDTLQTIRTALETYYAGELQPQNLPLPEPELLLFKGRDERVPVDFLRKAMETSRSVCRLQVPRVFNGNRQEGQYGYGTGWIIAPDLIITNHHVLDAREPAREPSATPEEFRQQAEGTVLWFDYLREGGTFLEVKSLSLEASDKALDYAILRVKETDPILDRPPLTLVSRPPQLNRGHRLNIIQYAGGGPLTFAIRNNFYVGIGGSTDFLRYLTDTAGGASGSPVLNDPWEVVGLHHAAQPITPEYYAGLPQERYLTLPVETAKGEVITYHNEGVALHPILDHLPENLRNEIALAQGWT